MNGAIDIAFGVTGQVLFFDAPEGRPSAVTSVATFDNANADTSSDAGAVSGSTPSVESSPITTTSGAAGLGQTDRRAIPLTSAAGVSVGRRYLLASSTGESEWVEVVAVSGSTVTVKHPLHNAYPSGSTFVSTRMSVSINSTWVADQAKLSEQEDGNPQYRVRWVYTIGFSTYVHDTYFDLVRYPGTSSLQPQDIDRMVPGWMDRLPQDHRQDQGRGLIADAHRAVRLDLLAIGRGDEMVANSEVFDELVRYKVIELGEWGRLLASAPGTDNQKYLTAREGYTTRFDTLVRITAKVPMRDSGGAAAPRPALPLTQR